MIGSTNLGLGLSRLWQYSFEFLASCLLVATVWAVDYLPTHDGPHHIYLAYVGNHFGHASTPYPSFYEPGRPLTALGFDLLFGPIESLLPWRDALRVTLSIIVLVWAWGARTLIVSVHPGRRSLGLLAFAAALQWSLYMGFFSYLLSTGLGFFVLAIALRIWPWSWERAIAMALLLLVQAFAHVFCASLTGVILLLIVGLRSESPGRLRALSFLGLMGVPVVGIAAYTSGLLSDPAHAETLASMGSVWPSWAKRVSYMAYLHVPGPIWKAWPLLILAVAGLADAIRRARKLQLEPLERPLAVGAILLLVAALILPLHVRGRWEFLSPRTLPVAIVLGISLVRLECLPVIWRRLATAGLATFVAASLIWSVWLHRSLEHACGDALSGLDDPVDRRGVRLPIVLDTKCGVHPFLRENHVFWVEPLLNVGALYAVQQGGVVPYVFALQPQIHPLVVTPETALAFPRVPDRRKWWLRTASFPSGVERSRALQELASYGAFFEDIIFWGTESDVEQFVQWGFRPDVRRRGLLVGPYEGCPTTLEILVPANTGGQLEISCGWGLLEQMEWGATMEVRARSEVQVVKSPRLRCPCGEVRVRGVFKLNASSSSGDVRLVCEGADEHGILRVMMTRASSPSCVLQ